MITIYHNPDCGTSRNTLALIRNSGVAPRIVEYLKNPPSRAELAVLLKLMGMTVRQLLREKGTPFRELGLDDPKWTDDELLDAMMAHPVLINRPIVVTPLGARLCRPSEAVLDILPDPQRGAFIKEDGERVVDEHGTGWSEMKARAVAAEFLGTALLLVAVVGSGIMAQRLSGGNDSIALLANALATGAALVVLIAILGPLSGAHFNPAVTAYFALRGELPWRVATAYVPVQIVAAVAGVWLAHAMFALPLLETSHHVREGTPQWLAEFIATFGLLATIAGAIRFSPRNTPMLVGLYIVGAYWFTASTSFANPAVTIARSLTASFSGIAPRDIAAFIVAQMTAVILGWPILGWLFHDPEKEIRLCNPGLRRRSRQPPIHTVFSCPILAA